MTDLSSSPHAILHDELTHALARAASRLLPLSAASSAAAELSAALASPAACTAAINLALHSLGSRRAATAVLAARSLPSARSRAVLDCLEDAVRRAPSLQVPLADAVALVDEHCRHKVTANSLRTLLMRHPEHHTLAARLGMLQLRGDLVVEVLGERHAQAKARRLAARQARARDVRRSEVTGPALADSLRQARARTGTRPAVKQLTQ